MSSRLRVPASLNVQFLSNGIGAPHLCAGRNLPNGQVPLDTMICIATRIEITLTNPKLTAIKVGRQHYSVFLQLNPKISIRHVQISWDLSVRYVQLVLAPARERSRVILGDLGYCCRLATRANRLAQTG